MNKVKMNLHFTGNYGVQEHASEYPCWSSEYIEWVEEKTDYLITVDEFNCLPEKRKHNIAVLMEPVSLVKKNYDFVLQNEKHFSLIFSTHLDYGDGSDKFKYYTGGARSFIRPEERQIYTKTDNVTCIMSFKRFLPGHELRHKVRAWDQSNNFNYITYMNPPMESKVDGLKDFRYDIVIENEDAPYFSEKLLDALLCGCIPIYYTELDTSYLNMFDMDGIVIVRSVEQLQKLLVDDMFTEDFYLSRMDAIRYNFEVAKRYVSFGDVLWNHGLKDFVERVTE
jgi:hypothetical protein